MAKGDTTKPHFGCHRKIPIWVPLFLATPLACCFESLKIMRLCDVYYHHRADVVHLNHSMLILSTVNSWMSDPIFLRENNIFLL